MHLQCFRNLEGRQPASNEVAFLYFRPISLIMRINFPLCKSDNKPALAAATSELLCSDFRLLLWGKQFAPAVLAVEEPGPRAGTWVPELIVGRKEFETSSRK